MHYQIRIKIDGEQKGGAAMEGWNNEEGKQKPLKFVRRKYKTKYEYEAKDLDAILVIQVGEYIDGSVAYVIQCEIAF